MKERGQHVHVSYVAQHFFARGFVFVLFQYLSFFSVWKLWTVPQIAVMFVDDCAHEEEGGKAKIGDLSIFTLLSS